MQNLGIWDNGDRGSKYVVKSAIFGIVNPNLRIHYAILMMIKGSLLLLSIFGRKKN